jgi:hypothetical protein
MQRETRLTTSVAGTGLMCTFFARLVLAKFIYAATDINNVGSILQMLMYSAGQDTGGPDTVRLQALQVSILSIFNSLGRALFGQFAGACGYLTN